MTPPRGTSTVGQSGKSEVIPGLQIGSPTAPATSKGPVAVGHLEVEEDQVTGAEEPQVAGMTGATSGAVSGMTHPEDQEARLAAEEVEPRRRQARTRVAEETADARGERPPVETATRTLGGTVETPRMMPDSKAAVAEIRSLAGSWRAWSIASGTSGTMSSDRMPI